MFNFYHISQRTRHVEVRADARTKNTKSNLLSNSHPPIQNLILLQVKFALCRLYVAALNSASHETITTVTLGNFPAIHRNDISPASIQHCIIPSFIFGIVFFFRA